jgi:hypothetical protein
MHRPVHPRPLALSLALGCLALAAGCAPADGEVNDRCEMPAAAIEDLSSISCATHTDTGYRSGTPFTITVVTVDGHPVERDTANAYYVMAQAAARAGVEIRVVSGFRTMAEQEHLYYCYTSCSCNSCNLAARPGYSNHQSGHALDLNTSARGVYAWLAAHGADYGFRRTVPSEMWHWEWWGGGPGGGPCHPAPPPPPPPPPDADHDGVRSDRDCDDHDAHRFPGNPEVCDGVDNDCDGRVDDGVTRSCGSSVGACRTGTETCSAGHWGSCEGAVGPRAETCNGEDDDCDGTVDGGQVCEREEAVLGAAASARTESDVDGDGRADACAVIDGRLSCVLGGAHGFDRALRGPSLAIGSAEAAGTVRMGDVDGDGRADVCAVIGHAFVCSSLTANGSEPLATIALGTSTTNGELADVDGDGRLDPCVRDADGLTCLSAHGALVLTALSDAHGYGDPTRWGTLRFGDLDGDGRSDVCARGATGLDCWRALDGRFGERIEGPRWSDASGWSAIARWATIRLADVDGDGRDDVCARGESGLSCVRSTGDGFGALVPGPALREADGWTSASTFASLRFGDVDGDGRADACAREQDRTRCWLSDGRALGGRVVLGPAIDPSAARTLSLGDVDADGRADLCALDPAGVRCVVSAEQLLDRAWITPAWSADALGAVGASSLRIGGGRAASAPAGSASLVGGCSIGHARSTHAAWLVALVLAALVRGRGRASRGSRA